MLQNISGMTLMHIKVKTVYLKRCFDYKKFRDHLRFGNDLQIVW